VICFFFITSDMFFWTLARDKWEYMQRVCGMWGKLMRFYGVLPSLDRKNYIFIT
jgi:hypothetical protein